VAASSASVESLGRGLVRVQDVSDQVQRLANRATLIAIQALSGTGEPASFGEELKQLARDVRDATDRTQRFAQDIDAAVADADARMKEAREQAMARMDAPAPPAGAPVPRNADTTRLIGLVLEIVQDAIRQGERVPTASERASVAERLARRLDGNASDAGRSRAPRPGGRGRGVDPAGDASERRGCASRGSHRTPGKHRPRRRCAPTTAQHRPGWR
jgi:hypothetical protein